MLTVLLSNDDGVYANGLKALQGALSATADIQIMAPDRDRSGASNSLTLSSPLRVVQVSDNVACVQGTPTDCVHLALTGYLDQAPDMVVSGINCGANMGDDVWYSGTVAAAMEGRFLGLPALAISLVASHTDYHYFETAGEVAKTIVEQIMKEPLPAGTILNINVPNIPLDQLRGYEVTRLGTRHQSQPAIKRTDPRGADIYWIGPPGEEQDAGLGTDFDAIRRHKVSITPLRVDLTDYTTFDQVSHWVKSI